MELPPTNGEPEPCAGSTLGIPHATPAVFHSLKTLQLHTSAHNFTWFI